MSTPNQALNEHALRCERAGRSVVPVAPHMKAPSLVATRDSDKRRRGESFHIRWKESYAKVRASEKQIRKWFLGTSTLMGMGVICGLVSGTEIDGVLYSLEVTECDNAETLEKFELLMVEWGYGTLLDQLPKELTPRMGAHFPYLTPVIEGNQPLARRKRGMNERGKDELEVLVETRGEGGFIVTSPTPPGIHPTVPGRGYELVRGSWEHLPIVTAEAREQIFACARALNEYFEEEHTDQESEAQRKTRIGMYPSDTPLGDYQARATTESMKTFLEGYGYTAIGKIRNGRIYMVRPGKDQKAGHSATLGYGGPGVLHVFSSADACFTPDKSYSPMYIYTYLAHEGNWKKAQQALATEGYGKPAKTKKTETPAADDPECESALATAHEILATLQNTPDSRLIYHALDILCSLPPEEWGPLKAEYKVVLGEQLNLRDLDRAYKDAKHRQWQARQPKSADSSESDARPKIQMNDRQLPDITRDAFTAILTHHAQTPTRPLMYIRSGALQRVVSDEDGHQIMELLTDAPLKGILARIAKWVSHHISQNGVSEADEFPPLDVVRDFPDSPGFSGKIPSR